MRIALEFEKKDAAKYISHLDLQRAFSRAIRRSGLPVALTKGFNPHYTVSFASALALGIESECECAEMIIEGDIDPGRFFEAMRASLPPGLYAKRAVKLKDNAPKLAASVSEAEYRAAIYEKLDEIKRAVCDIMDSEHIIIEKDGKHIDIRHNIFDLDVSGGCLMMRLAAAPSGSLRPDIVIGEIKKLTGDFSCDIVRTGLFTRVDGKAVGLLAAFGDVN
ncbi:MAG: TIGR03936 family radical SAM-associated protein [Burkholderiales bacterium]